MTLEFRGIGGNCPVQAYGKWWGREFYFRARGCHMQMHIAVNDDTDPLDDDAWYYEEDYGTGPFDAGWAGHDDCLAFMARAFKKWDYDHPIAEPPTYWQPLPAPPKDGE